MRRGQYRGQTSHSMGTISLVWPNGHANESGYPAPGTSNALRELVNRGKFLEIRDLAISRRKFHGARIPLTVFPPLAAHASANHCMKNW